MDLKSVTHIFMLYITLSVLMCSQAMAGSIQPKLSAEFSIAKSTFYTNETIDVVFSGNAGNATDWFGIYPTGVQPGERSATDWKYINDSRTASTVGINGKVKFSVANLSPGRYSLWFLANNGYTPLAPAIAFDVLSDADQPRILIQDPQLGIAENLAVQFNNPNASNTDWLGVYAKGTKPGPGSLAWAYLNGSKTATTAISSGLLELALPLTAGQYDLWLLATMAIPLKLIPLVSPCKITGPLPG